jgi:hypothetical protein
MNLKAALHSVASSTIGSPVRVRHRHRARRRVRLDDRHRGVGHRLDAA